MDAEFIDPGVIRNSAGRYRQLEPDEMRCGDMDKTATFGSMKIKSIILKNGIIQPMIITKNQTVGTWKQSIKKEFIRIEAYLLQKITGLEKEKIEEKAVELGYFLNKQVAVHFL